MLLKLLKSNNLKLSASSIMPTVAALGELISSLDINQRLLLVKVFVLMVPAPCSAATARRRTGWRADGHSFSDILMTLSDDALDLLFAPSALMKCPVEAPIYH